jgi:hypothetical protein
MRKLVMGNSARPCPPHRGMSSVLPNKDLTQYA